MSNLLRLMKDLGADAKLCDAYRADAKAVISRYGLTDKERKALLDHDYETIKQLTGLKDGQFATNSTISAYDADSKS